MDYDLLRIDYLICGITFPNTLKVLPATGPKTQQKIAIGDKNGVLQCLSIRDEEAVVQFKSLPGKPITSVQLAATAETHADKIFTASGNEVKGYTRKGKVFLTIETSLSETITSICVLGGDLVLGSGRMVTHYKDLREYHTYTCDDRVLDIAVFAAPNNTRLRLLILVANKGAVLFEGGQEAARVSIPSGPSRIAMPPYSNHNEVCALYGSADGSIGLLIYDGSELSSITLVEGRSLGPVMCLGWFFNESGSHLAVGRQDGSIQLYLVEMENLAEKPRLKFTYFCGEPVTSVTGGSVGTEETELLAATFSGRIFALRSRQFLTSTAASGNVPQDALAARRSKLEVDVARLEKQVANERDKYQRNTRAANAGGISAPPLLDIQCELSGATRDGWQEARVMSAVPLDMLFVYCTTTLELETDSAAVLSFCPPQISSGSDSDLLATVRCQAGTRRLWLRVRRPKGREQLKSTRLLIYALPAGAPRVARMITLKLPALPYYSKHLEPDALEKELRSWCQLIVAGSFSVAEMTSWLTEALPGELPRPSAAVSFARSHVLLHTNLICRYQKGQALIKSENVSTVVVLRDLISNCSVKRSIRIDITCDIPKNCCVKHFSIIEDQFKNEYQKHQDDVLGKAISSLDLDANSANEENPILCDEYLRISKALTDKIETNFEELVETVECWYEDWAKLLLHHSNDSFNDKQKLITALRNCQIDEIKNIFKQN